jgi:hypothetical protein
MITLISHFHLFVHCTLSYCAVFNQMAQPLLGFGMLVISGIMLASMDSYFGIPMLALKLVGGTWIKASQNVSFLYAVLFPSIC